MQRARPVYLCVLRISGWGSPLRSLRVNNWPVRDPVMGLHSKWRGNAGQKTRPWPWSILVTK
uniref:Uncharacterized protein n=1 Tax=Anguilla anguilla TaxID=7936 RepID=A0A0E9XDX8_ANGAN